jgi:hypothetical protein
LRYLLMFNCAYNKRGSVPDLNFNIEARGSDKRKGLDKHLYLLFFVVNSISVESIIKLEQT